MWYRRGQSSAPVRIVKVHHDAPPEPYYTVQRTDESSSGYIITDRDHLLATSELDSTPPLPAAGVGDIDGGDDMIELSSWEDAEIDWDAQCSAATLPLAGDGVDGGGCGGCASGGCGRPCVFDHHNKGEFCDPVSEWALDPDSSSASGRHVGTSRKGKGGGNPRPHLARKGGDKGRIDSLNESFKNDMFTRCNSYLMSAGGHSPFRTCTHTDSEGRECRERLVMHYGGDLNKFRHAVQMERSAMAARSRDELHDMLRQIVEVEHKQERAGRGGGLGYARRAGAHTRRACVCCNVVLVPRCQWFRVQEGPRISR